MTIKINEAIQAYVKMRDAITERSRAEKDWKKGIVEQMDKLEQFILIKCDELGTETFKAGGNTAFKTFKDSVTVSDKESFKKHIASTLLTALQPWSYRTTEGDWQPDGESDLNEHIEKILESGAFDLITLAANKNNCKEFMSDHDGSLPAGVDYRKEVVVQIRKGSK